MSEKEVRKHGDKKNYNGKAEMAWDLSLPKIEGVDWPEGWYTKFDARFFLSTPKHELLSDYLARARGDLMSLHSVVEGHPLLFYIVTSQRTDLLRIAISAGANIHCTSAGKLPVPLLPFVVMYGYKHKTDMGPMIRVLLGAGAKVLEQIPSWYLDSAITEIDPGTPLPHQTSEISKIGKKWYTEPEYRADFRAAADMNLRHCLRKAAKIQARPRNAQVAGVKNAESMIELPYTLVGQTLAANRLRDILIERRMDTETEPLVLVFAGPSGHGKTELASKLGELLKIDTHKVDCASGDDQNDFFGIAGQYDRGDISTPLNAFLALKDGDEGIIVLDEFEKTDRDFHNGLLNPFDRGEYKDRTNNAATDCKQIIWVLTSNIFDSTISNFYQKHKKVIGNLDTDFEAQQECYRKLIRILRKEAISKFHAPLAGRITDFIPFLPFDQEEQVVGVELLVKQFIASAKLPVSLKHPERLFGNVDIDTQDFIKLCKFIADDAYIPELGMRSLKNAVRVSFKSAVFDKYLGISTKITEPAPMTEIVSGISKDLVIADVARYNGQPYKE